MEHLIGYLNTWSAVKHFINQNNYNPTHALQVEIERKWNEEQMKQVQSPLLLRLGQITK
ncbi:MAG: hypothetical protein H6604_02485 [Flavobacteriales bacterium]|nr:hypothetical protein [Flavobacteriales bacterium]